MYIIFFKFLFKVLKAAVNEISNLSRGQVSAEELNRAK